MILAVATIVPIIIMIILIALNWRATPFATVKTHSAAFTTRAVSVGTAVDGVIARVLTRDKDFTMFWRTKFWALDF